ncbi:phage tail tape measure protein [Romboutsia sp. 1001216sp1]|uniref:phage tail tape measure protein n=1 Tax=Romboutsia sp. 1001216sp1 TaxID=2986997 RepID=UPI00232F0CE9|nr:phage tail tape measure protein [Romboutsia sp. 1001216sp1]MDB8790893.1 phage tail tape measure protein [Romboutsia sp. 1001216sp1]
MSRSQEIANLQVGLDLEMQSFARELSNTKKNVRNLAKDFDVASKSIDNAEDKVEAYTKALEKGNRAFDATEKKLQMQNKQFDDLYKKTEKQKKQYDELADELKKAEKALADMVHNGDKNSNAYKEQEKAVKGLKKALADKLELIQKNSHKLQQYSTDIDKTSNDMNKLKSSINELETSFKTMGEGTEELALIGESANDSKLSLDNLALGAKASAVAIASVFAKNVYDGAIAFDDAITGLRLSLGLAEEDAKALYEQINNIAGDGGYSLEGVSEAVKLLEQRFNLGAKETESLAQSMDLLAKMGYESADVTRFMTSAVNDWGMTHSQALDMIIAGEQSGLNMSQDWLDTLVEYTPILSTLGVSGQEAFALVDEAVNATGMSTDQAMDMVKEFFLTLTDGSTTSKDAFKDLGIDIEDLKSKIDSGSITSVQAMEQVMQAITGVSDETERARLLQEIFKGTIEYGSEGVVQAWTNIETSVSNTAGAMDEAKQAYEESYQAMQQDLSNEWNELTQTIGSGVLPTLTKIIDFAGKIVESMGLIPFATTATFTKMGNDIGNVFDGALAKVLEFVMGAGEGISNFADFVGMDDWADSIDKRMEDVKGTYDGLVDNIKERNEENERLNEEHSRRLEEIWGNTKLEPDIDGTKEKVIELTTAYENIPKDVQTVLKVDSEESKDKALKLYNIYEQLPPEIQTLIKADNYKALEGAKTVQDILANIPVEKRVALLTNIQEQGNMSAEQLQLILDSLPEEERIKIETAVNGKEQVEQTKKELDNLPKQSTSKVNVDTGDSKSKVQGVKQEAESMNGKVYKATFKTDTATASKNVTGLKNNISDYDRKNTGKTKTTKFSTVTAQASKNVTGLKNNISSFVSKYAKTFTTTFKVVTKYSTVGTPTPQSQGAKPKTISVPTPVEPIVESARRTFEPYANYNQDNVPNMDARAVSRPTIAIGGNDIFNSIKYNVELLQELENAIKDVNNQLSLLDKKMKNASGRDKVKYLEEQNVLYQEQLQLQKDLEDKLIRQKNYYEYFLKNKGFQFTPDGNLKNYEEKLILMEKELEKLEEIADAKQKAESSYKGDNDKHKDKLSKEYDLAKENVDKYKKSLDEIKTYLEEYIDVSVNKLPDVREEFIDINNAIKDNINSIKEFENQLKDLKEDSRYKDHNRDILEVQNKLDKNKVLLDGASGQKEIDLLNERIKLTKQLQKETQDLLGFENQRRKELMNELGQYGFKFRNDGSIEGYGGKIEELKKTLSEDEFSKVFEKVEEYLDTTYDKIPDLENEWESLNNEMSNMKDTIADIIKEQNKMFEEAKYQELTDELNDLSKELDLIEKKLKHATGSEKIGLLDKQLELLEKQKKEINKQYNYILNKHSELQNKLKSVGFKFDSNGDVSNYSEQLKHLMNTSKDFEDIQEILEAYFELQNEELPKLEGEWIDLENAIKDSLKEQLDVVKDIEDEITKVYKKQVEDRIDLINKELDSRLDALDKEKDAYNKAREEAKYQDNYNEQMEKVKNLEKQLEIAKKDTSLIGQKKVQDLLNQLKDEQKKLQDMVQDKIDDQVNDMFDQESDRLTDSAEDAIKNLEDKFSDSKIAELVAQALGSGVFTDIEGNVSNLEDALIDFAKETGDLFGVLGSTIEQELIGKLKEALDTFEDLDDILDKLDINSKTRFSIPNVDYSSSRYTPSSSNNSTTNNTNNRTVEVNFNQPLVNIEGSVSEDIMPQVEKMVKQAQDDLLHSIVRELR